MEWKPSDLIHPVAESTQLSAFISYAHEWRKDADFITQVLKTYGIRVWLDNDRLQVGGRLTDSVIKAIRSCDYFVPLLSLEYVSSPWCMRELETAAEHGIEVIPIKTSEGDLYFPPHVKSLYEGALGEPVFLDLRRRDPTVKLRELAARMGGG